MFLKTRGIVLQTIKHSETSVIARIYTEQLGRLSFMINGVRTSKSVSKAAMLQPGTLLEMDFLYQENKKLHYIKDFKRAHVYQSIPFDTRKSAMLMFIIEVVSHSLHDHEENEEQFEFVYDQLAELDRSTVVNAFYHLQFLLFFTQHLGFFPTLNYSVHNPVFDLQSGHFCNGNGALPNMMNATESAVLNDLLHSTPFERPNIACDRQVKNNVLEKLLQYFALHIDSFRNIQSHHIFESVFA